ncbi:ATP-dependent helicase [Archangium gephyra]|uniref:UvrD-helicase domain-containing protein n=1 Tax=Archangium gephyra TaxID=48 RepID=UPI0035D50629
MLPLEEFVPVLRQAIAKFRPQPGRPPPPNPEQEACILHPLGVPLQIVAGPGSGKTTVLVLRAIRAVVVDGRLPEHVLLATFTRKAADEIRTRLIEWGLDIIGFLRRNGAPALRAHLAHVDVNRFVTGTLDSICEEALRSLRAATDPAPSLLEGFAADALLLRRGLGPHLYENGTLNPGVASYLARLASDQQPPANAASLIKLVRPLFDRFSHDEVDLSVFRRLDPSEPRELLARGYEAYRQHLAETNRLDFALLEKLFHERLAAGRLSRFTSPLKAILVDEYQDTNLLQERIYFELCRQTGASLTVVGDDDQSLYRFRGATVELFRDFRTRLQTALPGASASRLDLVANYRSTPEIVSFFNSFIQNDPDFVPARVQPPKPLINAQLPSANIPVLGLFRPNADALAADLATFLCDVFRGPGRVVPGAAPDTQETIRADPHGGDFGDAVLLAHTVNEFTAPYMGQPPRPRLPYLLRHELQKRDVRVFNPRGQALRDIEDVQQLLGAMLECLDPGAARQNAMLLRTDAANHLNTFRAAYRQFASTHPPPNSSQKLSGFVAAWGQRRNQAGGGWPLEWPVLELCFKLLTWFPRLRGDPEGQVHLEAISRAIAQSTTFSTYRALVMHGQGLHDGRSVESAIRDIFAPLAEGQVDVDEDIMPHVPRDRFGFMTIHQAKGLEFPLVIVDVASDFSRDHHRQRFRRFPEAPSNVAELEDELASATPIGPLRQTRNGMQRTFEDLLRLYYVAYSRPQSVLLLVGLDQCLQQRTRIRNVATSWRRDGTWPWAAPYTGKRPPGLVNNHPLRLI